MNPSADATRNVVSNSLLEVLPWQEGDPSGLTYQVGERRFGDARSFALILRVVDSSTFGHREVEEAGVVEV